MTRYRERDGIAWLVSRGAAPSFTKLEDSLSDVMTLFKAKFGENVDYDNEKESEQELPRRSRGVRITSPT